jgi:hypothetical protein
VVDKFLKCDCIDTRSERSDRSRIVHVAATARELPKKSKPARKRWAEKNFEVRLFFRLFYLAHTKHRKVVKRSKTVVKPSKIEAFSKKRLVGKS